MLPRQWKELLLNVYFMLVSFHMDSRQKRKDGMKVEITPRMSLEEGRDQLFLLYGEQCLRVWSLGTHIKMT